MLNGQFDNTSWVDLNDEDELVETRITCDRNYHRSTSVTSFACDCTGESVPCGRVDDACEIDVCT